MSIISKIFTYFTNDGVDIIDEPYDDFSFRSYFYEHIDEVRKTVLIEDNIKDDGLHFCFIIAHRLYLRGIDPYESIVVSSKYCSNNPNSYKRIKSGKIDKVVRKIHARL